METLFTWLHLSDLQIRAAHDEGQSPGERVLAALRYDVEERAGDPVDAVLVTGDVAATGQRDEYVEADAFLTQLVRAAGLGPERAHLVAGNHDIDRSADRAPLTAKLVAELRQGRRRFDAALEHERAREVLASRLYGFTVFAATFGPPVADDAPPEELLWWSHRAEGRAGLKVRFVGLCTSFVAEGDGDRGVLRIGERQLLDAAAAARSGELVVALSHHPARGGWLADERDVDAWLREHAHVHLTGHVHDPIADEARAGSPGTYVWIAAGATPAKRKLGLGAERRLGYARVSVVRADDGALSLRVEPRRWSPEGNRFVADDRNLPKGEPAVLRALRMALPITTTAPPPALGTLPPPAATPASIPPPRASTSPAATRSTPPARAALPFAPTRPAFEASDPSAEARPITVAPPAARPITTAPPAARARLDPLQSAARRDTPGLRSALSDATRPAPSAGLFEGPGALPAMPVPLFGERAEALAALEDLLADPAVTGVVVAGPGGVGKTVIAQQLVATRASERFDESAWLDGRDLPAELGRVAKRFGFRPERAPRPEETVRFLRAALEERRALLVVDDLSPTDVRLVPMLGGASRVLVTSRLLTLHEDLGRGARRLHLDLWHDAACRAHLRALVPALAAEPDDILDALAQRVGGLPLAVRLVGRQLVRPDVTPESLLARLDRDPLATLDGGARGGESTLSSTFRPTFETLGAPLRRVLVALAACATATRADVVAEIAGVRQDEAALALEGFAEQSLVEHAPDAERPFRAMAAVRFFLRDQPGAAEAESTHEGLVLASVLAHGPDPARWSALARDLPEVLAVIDRRIERGDAAPAWEILKAIIGVLERHDRHADVAAIARRILRITPEGSATAAAVLADLGLSQCSLGDLSGAQKSLARALALAEGHGHREAEALALGGLGRMHATLGELDKALAHHRRAAAIHEALAMRTLLAVDLGNAGLALRRLGNVADAIAHLERALALHEESELDGRAEVLGGLGLCFRDRGDLAAAVDHFQRALEIHDMLGRRAGAATMLGNLGNTYRALGEIGRAVEHLTSALSIYEELGLLEGQGLALANLGACFRSIGETEKAREHAERALSILRRLGLPDEHPHVRTLLATLVEAHKKPRR
ncbi:diguanylate cyclase/phosphodiesterase (GGDEF & EAL domains) with PAS/PAC sensor [Minicystis rosea]|nr:diguanylate cyclase/phosphodiesterase (GGDEF & EAL domains) with PAS/PAC sensor [Minicystis rosea]